MITNALISLFPGTKWYIKDEEIYENLVWSEDNTIPKPSLEVLTAEANRLKIEYDANKYQRDRKPEYPSLPEQLDMQYWDAINGTTTWQDAINAVKAKYPKPTES
jgi:hypothetical protein